MSSIEQKQIEELERKISNRIKKELQIQFNDNNKLLISKFQQISEDNNLLTLDLEALQAQLDYQVEVNENLEIELEVYKDKNSEQQVQIKALKQEIEELKEEKAASLALILYNSNQISNSQLIEEYQVRINELEAQVRLLEEQLRAQANQQAEQQVNDHVHNDPINQQAEQPVREDVQHFPSVVDQFELDNKVFSVIENTTTQNFHVFNCKWSRILDLRLQKCGLNYVVHFQRPSKFSKNILTEFKLFNRHNIEIMSMNEFRLHHYFTREQMIQSFREIAIRLA